MPDMWRRLVHPDLLVYLDAENDALRRRRPGLTDAVLATQRERLAHARDHADLVVDTTERSPEEVIEYVRGWLDL